MAGVKKKKTLFVLVVAFFSLTLVIRLHVLGPVGAPVVSQTSSPVEDNAEPNVRIPPDSQRSPLPTIDDLQKKNLIVVEEEEKNKGEKLEKSPQSPGQHIEVDPNINEGQKSAERLQQVQLQQPKEEGIVSIQGCPPLVKPNNISFIVINLDRSKGRLQRMEELFQKLQLPPFVRVAGVEYSPNATYDVQKSEHLKPADFGCFLGHRAAWKAIAEGSHEWVVVLEDDIKIPSRELILDFPLIPADADMVLLFPQSVIQSFDVCSSTTVKKFKWGYGTTGYLTSKKGAARLLDDSKSFNLPVDGHILYHGNIYNTAENRVSHDRCGTPCKDSVRVFLNGEIPDQPD